MKAQIEFYVDSVFFKVRDHALRTARDLDVAWVIITGENVYLSHAGLLRRRSSRTPPFHHVLTGTESLPAGVIAFFVIPGLVILQGGYSQPKVCKRVCALIERGCSDSASLLALRLRLGRLIAEAPIPFSNPAESHPGLS